MDAKPPLLIVDDEETLATALGVKFGKNGFSPEICYDGATAIEKLKAKPYVAILLDIVMQGTDGYAVLQARAGTPNENTPVYVLTALGQEDHLERAKQLGARKCYVKSMSSIGDVLKEIKADLGIA